MEANDVSFSIPVWRRQEIKSLSQLQEEMVYAASPYDLDDFRSQPAQHQSIFESPQPSNRVGYSQRRAFNSELAVELAFLVILLEEAITQHYEMTENSPVQQLK
jgi:hypothetical protein